MKEEENEYRKKEDNDFILDCKREQRKNISDELKTMIRNNFGAQKNLFDFLLWDKESQERFLYLMHCVHKEEQSVLKDTKDVRKLPNKEIFNLLKTGRLENDLYEYAKNVLYKDTSIVVDTGFCEKAFYIGEKIHKQRDIGDIHGVLTQFAECICLYKRCSRSFKEFISLLLLSVEIMNIRIIYDGEYEKLDSNQLVKYDDLTGSTRQICDYIIDLAVWSKKLVYRRFGIVEVYLLSLFLSSTIKENIELENIYMILLSSERKEKRGDSLSEEHIKICINIIWWLIDKHFLDYSDIYFEMDVFALIVKEIWQDKTKYRSFKKRKMGENNIGSGGKEKKPKTNRDKAAFEIAKDILDGKYKEYGDLSEDIIYVREKVKRAVDVVRIGEEQEREETRKKIKRLRIECLVLSEIGNRIQMDTI